MLKFKTTFGLLLFISLLLIGCSKKVEKTTENPLPSWNDGSSKTSIMNFVKDVTNKNSSNFVPVKDRIATFDNDGTLWSEQPMYFQLFFTIDRVKAIADKHPEWKKKQPFKSILENDMKALVSFGKEKLLELVMATHAGTTTTEFEQIVKDWVVTAKHPRFDKPFTDLVFQPMLELLEYLRANDFKTYIVSGGGVEFMRPLTKELYGIPPEQVIGTTLKTKFEIVNGKPQIIRLPEVDFIDDKAGKPIAINKFIGKKPIAAFGNSDGDLQMLQWTASNDKPNFML